MSEFYRNKAVLKREAKVRVGITMGDPSGIGPDIIAAALPKVKGLAEFVVIGDEWVFNKALGSRFKVLGFRFIDLNNVSRKNFRFGKVRAEYGRDSIEYLDRALELIKNKEIECLVTGPISKEAINLAGFNFNGHTEYLSLLTQTRDIVMMLLNDELKISLVTRHIPLKKVPSELNQAKLYKTIVITWQYLKKFFLIKEPRIVVCGLNPHASDNGIIGNEENRTIKPVLKKLKTKIPYIDGPLSADVAMYKTRQKEYDCVIAMYHDQALIALKLLGINRGVNITLGLPFIRTSPLHGTAFDIAGRGLADCSSLVEAINLSVRCALNQKSI